MKSIFKNLYFIPKRALYKVIIIANCLLPAVAFGQSTRLWATYYGGSGDDRTSNYTKIVTTDGAGNVYMTGYTYSISGIASGGFQNTYGGGADAFLVKFSPSGTRLWATYYGGTGNDYGASVATDAVGNVYLAGETWGSSSVIASSGFQNIYGGGLSDAFLVKFDANGNRLWATYYGGSGAGNEGGKAVATDAMGNVYLAGNTTSTSNIASGGFQNTPGPGFLVKFNSSGARLWATYYNAVAYSLATDAMNNVYMTGYTMSSSGIASGGFQNNIAGGADAFLVKFDAAGSRLWATYYGGTGDDPGYSVTTDASGNVYLGGQTKSSSGIASGGFQNTYAAGWSDAFLVKFDAAGSRLWATYYGGTGDEYGYIVTTDAAGDVCLAGTTTSSSGIASGGFQNTYWGAGVGAWDGFVVRFNSAGARQCATYYQGSSPTGGNLNLFAWSATMDVSGNVYFAGYTQFTSGIAFGGFQNTHGGIWDGFLVKFISCGASTVLNATAISTNVLCYGQCTGTGIANPANGTTPYTYLWNCSPAQTTKTATGLCAGSYTVIVTDAIAATTTATITITQPLSALSSSLTSSNASCVGQCNGSATVNASGGTPGYAYSWNSVPIQTNTNATGLCAGNYTCTITDANGCTNTATATVTVNPLPSVVVSCPTDPCFGGTYTISVSSSVGNTYSWSTGATGNSITVIATSVGTYYSVTVTDSITGCRKIDSCLLANPPDAVINIIGNDTVCAGNSLTLTTISGQVYFWSTGATTFTPSIIVNPTATTTYFVVVVNGLCWDSAFANITVLPSPAASISGNSVICMGFAVTLTATGGGTYAWSSGETTAMIYPNTAGNYSVIVTIGSCTDTANAMVVVNPSPTATAASTNILCSGGNDGTAAVTVAGGTPSYTYLWSPTGGTGSVAAGLSAGVYTIIVTDANGCSNTQIVTIDPSTNAEELNLPNAFSPNNDGENDEFCLQGVIEPCIKELKIIIYDRWGEKAYESTDPKFCWDGIHTDLRLNPIETTHPFNTAVFVYYLNATLISGDKIIRKGNISLIK